MHLEESSLSGYAMLGGSVRMRFLSDHLFIFDRCPDLHLMYIVLCCRHGSSSNSLYPESATVMLWFVKNVPIFIMVVYLPRKQHPDFLCCIFSMKQVCHRDLKLENTLLDGSPAPRLKICDFGYSKVLVVSSFSSVICRSMFAYI